MMHVSTEPLGQILVRDHQLDPKNLELALREHEKTRDQLGSILINMGILTEEAVLRGVATQHGVPFVKLSSFTIPPEIIQLIPAKVASHYRVVPVEEQNGTLKVALVDPLDINTLDSLTQMLQCEVEAVVSTTLEINDAIKSYYGIGADTVEQMMDDQESSGVSVEQGDVEDIDDMAEDASIMRFVNQIIAEAFSDRATDIHIEPMEQDLRIRYRIDGLLYAAAVPPAIKRFQSAIISRVKIMADMNIAERRLPQDGKIKVSMADKDFDLRVSTVPTPSGESISIRILSRDDELINLEKQGLDEHNLALIREMIHKPHGILLVTGPTGSGKSTTLYGSLSEINSIDRKIMTVEDPIEYRIKGVTQIQVQPDIGLTFARCLRTMLRQDPDIIMVGEVRDTETAQMAIRTALTGHLVFSTLHTNDSCGAIARLIDMGIEPFLVSSTVDGIVAQRLVRKLCSECKAEYRPDPELLSRLNLNMEINFDDVSFFRPVGCKRCRYTGHYGRTAIYEIVKINDGIKRLVVDRADSNVIRKLAVAEGLRPIRDDGFLKIMNGSTTIEEVMRMTMEDEFENY